MSEEQDNLLVFCGSMDWLPNEDAMLFFLGDILPLVSRAVPLVKLVIVGRNPSPVMREVVARWPQVTLTGWVDDTRPHIARAAVFIVPIRVGGGTRLKIYEGMSMGKAVISTRIGAEGLVVENGRNIAFGDSAEEFSRQLVELLQNRDRRTLLGSAAREHVCASFSSHMF